MIVIRASLALAFLCLVPGQALSAPEQELAESQKSLPLGNSDAHSFEIDSDSGRADHRLSGLVCPFEIEGHTLSGVYQFSLSGHDISCRYDAPGRDSKLTFYFSRYGTEATADWIVESALDGMRQAGTTGETIRSGPVEVSFGDLLLEGCRETVLNVDPIGATQKSSALGCNLDGWAYKVRATWSSPDSLPAGGMASFAAAQRTARQRLDACAVWRQSTETEAAVLGSEPAALLAILTGMAADAETGATYTLADDCFVYQAGDDQTAYLMTASPSDGPIAWQISKLGIEGVIQQSLMRIQREIPGVLSLLETIDAPDGASIWFLAAQLSDTETGILRLYLDRPSREQAMKDLSDAMNGKIASLSSIELHEGGGSTINFAVD